MKVFVKIFIFGFLGQLLVLLIIAMFGFKFLKGYEKIEVILGLLGLATTFLGAYLGAKIAGNESRNLFKQEMKINDLSKNMDINLEVLKDIESVKLKMNFINESIRNSDSLNLNPEFLRELQSKSKQVNDDLEQLKNKKLNKTAVILYSDIQQFCLAFEGFYNKMQNIINVDETRKLFKNVKGNKIPLETLSRWTHLSQDSDKYFHAIIEEDRVEKKVKISFDTIITENKKFFEKKKYEIEWLFHEVNISFNNMKYLNRNDLIKEYTKLYKD